MYVCMHVGVYVLTHVRTYIHTCKDAYLNTSVQTIKPTRLPSPTLSSTSHPACPPNYNKSIHPINYFPHPFTYPTTNISTSPDHFLTDRSATHCLLIVSSRCYTIICRVKGKVSPRHFFYSSI